MWTTGRKGVNEPNNKAPERIAVRSCADRWQASSPTATARVHGSGGL